MERLERVQAKVLKRILELPDKTPYWPILREVGIIPIELAILYQRLMLYQNLMTSEEGRLGKQIVREQKERKEKNTWYSETEKKARQIEVDINQAEGAKKADWKRYVKEKIKESAQKKIEKEETRKARHQKGQSMERKRNLKEMGIKEASKTVSRRLEMYDIDRK